MPILQATNIRHNFGADIILEGATLAIEPGERVGLVGRNGAGKSTLFKVIAGLLKPDSGTVGVTRGRRIGYLTQDPTLDPDETLRGAAEGAFADLHAAHAELDGVFEAMADAEGDELDRLLKRQARLEERMEALGGYAVEHRIDEALHGLGFIDAQFGIRCASLSGGQRSRLALVRLLLEAPDVLLLDEPTNHLDIPGRLWLENFLVSEYPGAVLMITHDRRMLDNVVTKIFEVEQGRLIEYPGNYQKFRELRRERREVMMRAFEKQQTKFRQEEEYIRRYKTGQRAKEARGRQSKLDRAKRDNTLEKPTELSAFKFSLPKAARASDIVVSARGLSKVYNNTDASSGEPLGEKVLFRDFEVSIGRGERWGVIGPNGAGKTTLVRCMLGDLAPDSGSARLGTNVQVGYFRQIAEPEEPDIQVYRAIQRLVVKENPDAMLSEQQARDLAGAFLFSGDEQEKPVGVLSGGERARVRLAALIASGKNLLVLDEPTNHLDIPSAERLEEALSRDGVYEGALILISHDRALIDATCERLIVLDGRGGCEVFLGNYSMWRDKQLDRENAAAQEKDRARQDDDRRRREEQARLEAKQKQAPRPAQSTSGLSRLRTEQLEEKIEKLQSRIGAIDKELLDPAVWQDAKRSQRLGDERSRLSEELEPLEFEWSRRAEEG